MLFRDILKRLMYGYRASSSSYVDKLRSLGASIGDDVTIYFPEKTTIDITAPHLISIGNHVKVTGPITILTRDYSWSVIKGKTGEILGNQKPVSIGNNVFIGWGATVLCGTTIEDNVIIGAHSVVSGHIPHDTVWGGAPAKCICSLGDYRNKRLAAQEKEAKTFVRSFRQRYGKDPKPEDIPEYFFLFADADHLCGKYQSQISLMGTREKSMEILSSPRQYENFQRFLDTC